MNTMKKKTGTKKLVIDTERCKGCVFCVHACPQGALGMSDEVNKKGHQFAVLKYPDKCTRCGFCVLMCPDCSIEIIEGEEKQ